MKVSIDGGETYLEVDEVRVVHHDVEIPGEDERGDLQIVLTREGMVTDVWSTDRDGEDHNVGSSCAMVSDIVCNLCEANA